MRDPNTLPPCVIAIVGASDDLTRRVTHSVRRALAPKPDLLHAVMDINPPMDRPSLTDITSSKRRYRVIECAEPPWELPARALDAAVLVVSATASVHDVLRRLAFTVTSRGPCPLVVFVTRCANRDALRDLVEIEVRELLESLGRAADDVPFVFSELDGDRDDDESARALFELLDEHATVCVQSAETPVVARVGGNYYDGWTSLEMYSGVLSLKRSLAVIDGAWWSDALVRDLRWYARDLVEFGLGFCNTKLTVPSDEDAWVLSSEHMKLRTVVDLAVFDAVELSVGWSSECFVRWAIADVRGTFEVQSLGEIAPNLGRVRVTLSQPVPFVPRMYTRLQTTWPMATVPAIVLPDE
ncbi:MAG: hypothetical protein JNK05_36670 [Myxococcales bacterium]|nr:hypothetical protein [Myxococcales bacterium]